jgi:chemotaxis protein MotB
MKRIVLALALVTLLTTSCVSKKKFVALEAKNKEIQDLLNSCTVKLNMCLTEKDALSSQIEFLKKNNENLIQNMDNMTTLSTKGAQNIEKALETIKEKDIKISRMQDAFTKKDSVTLALVTSIKSSVGVTDPDIEVNVEKGVVFISIADKLLFKSGSTSVDPKGQEALVELAKALNKKADVQVAVEGHTDNVPMNGETIKDNWDLSVLRATSIAKIMINEGKLSAKRISANGRGETIPVATNDTPEGRAKNRRTEIILTPQLDKILEILNNN